MFSFPREFSAPRESRPAPGENPRESAARPEAGETGETPPGEARKRCRYAYNGNESPPPRPPVFRREARNPGPDSRSPFRCMTVRQLPELFRAITVHLNLSQTFPSHNRSAKKAGERLAHLTATQPFAKTARKGTLPPRDSVGAPEKIGASPSGRGGGGVVYGWGRESYGELGSVVA